MTRSSYEETDGFWLGRFAEAMRSVRDSLGRGDTERADATAASVLSEYGQFRLRFTLWLASDASMARPVHIDKAHDRADLGAILEDGSGHATTDYKHPDFYDNAVGIWDNREKCS